MFSLVFWKDAAERAVKTFAQTAVAFLVAGAGFGDINWVTVGSVSGVAAIGSILTSIISSQIGDPSASLVEARRGKHSA